MITPTLGRVRALLQRVTSATVRVDGQVVGSIGRGLCAFVGVARDDDTATAAKLARRMWGLRMFEDADGQTNLSAEELEREILVVSQFTLYADTSRGRRPSFTKAAPPDQAERLVDAVIAALAASGARVQTGRFRASMAVELVNDGPFTILLEV